MFKFRCPACERSIGVQKQQTGRKLRCPHCDAAIVVPTASAEREPPSTSPPIGGAKPPVRRQPNPAAPPPQPSSAAAVPPAAPPAHAAEQATTAAPAGRTSPPVGPAASIAIEAGKSPTSATRRIRRKKSPVPLILTGLAAATLLVVGLVVAFRPGDQERPEPSPPAGLTADDDANPDSQVELAATSLPTWQPTGPEAAAPPAVSSGMPAAAGPAADSREPRPGNSTLPEFSSPTTIPGADDPAAGGTLPTAAGPNPDGGPPGAPLPSFAADPTAAEIASEASDALAELTDQERGAIRAMYADRSLFSVKNYADLRGLFAARFQRRHAPAIRAAFGEDRQGIQAWFDEHPQVRDELYTALDPEVDDLQRGLQLFRELWTRFPERLESYGNLAIAIAVTWDQPAAIYDYAQHQRRAKATMPEPQADAIGNFEYFLLTEAFMQGRGQWLPWEFLVHVVNHKTPLDERQWALQRYVNRRVMIGKCYHDVPYDDLMLESNSQTARLNGHVYNLPNLVQYGGVCAHQADFASRVGQSVGAPSAYVGGESSYGEGHAWVMWVEIKAVNSQSVLFALESHGRYRGDKYYVGNLRDPRSGQRVTDRQLELRLHTVGRDPAAQRHARRAMQAYPWLVESESLAVNDRFTYLNQVIKLCPGNEQAWEALAAMASDETVREKHRKQMSVILNLLFENFAAYPDFTWTVFDDLIAFEDRLKERIGLYQRLVLLYQAAGRPDLACEARLRQADLLLEDQRPVDAIEGLAITIQAFVDDGRYVPRMLDRIESIAAEVEGARPHVLRFYQAFLPRIPQMRGDRPSPYCMEMFRRGIERFREAGDLQSAQFFAAQLAQIEAGAGRRDR